MENQHSNTPSLQRPAVQARFLLGPAGSGKTCRCIADIRAELLRSPDGPPLIFLAPKQATFQIERQLLADSNLKGYSRLHILSFERLARFVFDQLNQPVPELLSEEGRVMVLRALLARNQTRLKIFRASARLTGFATQLSLLLREFQRSRVSPAALAKLAEKVPGTGRLNDKLHDLALMLREYESWLARRRSDGHNVNDANRLLDLAVEAMAAASVVGQASCLSSGPHELSESNNISKPQRTGETPVPLLQIGGLWLDGFAEMTPQEQALLAALMPRCNHATLAFCLDDEPRTEISWLSPWTVVGRTFARCRDALSNLPGIETSVEVLPRNPSQTRFDSAALLELERNWAGERNAAFMRQGEHQPLPDKSGVPATAAIQLVACPNIEAEATHAAREIRKHVQAGGRYRDCAVLVRSLDGYHDILRRVLSRFEIPFFLDRREAVAHHPLAELTRYALRTVTFDWRHEDWFGALKTGLTGVADEDVDALENESLRHGWVGKTWFDTLRVPDDAELGERMDAIRKRVLPPFDALAKQTADAGAPVSDPAAIDPGTQTRRIGDRRSTITGRTLAAAIRELWASLSVESQLKAWSERTDKLKLNGAAHTTVWTQLNEWLASVEIAFADEALPLREWLPILESGLAGMSAGVIPPSLDQVLVGSVDRSRNPDLHTAFVLGVNEGVFPAPPAPGVLLTDRDRSEIEAHGITLGTSQRQQLGHERYFGYIALTRARRRLVVTWAEADGDGRTLNPSPFVAAIKRAVPEVNEEQFVPANWTEALHRDELLPHVLARSSPEGFRGESAPFDSPASWSRLTSAATDQIARLATLDTFAPTLLRMEQARDAVGATKLSEGIAAKLYGNVIATSVSALEEFTACPFHFLAARGLKAEEREEFVVDAREKGSFQHDVLQKFHEHVKREEQDWRNLEPADARQIIRTIGEAVAKDFRGGLMNATEAARFTASVLIGNLERLIETLIGWAKHNSFDPTEVEVGFGLKGSKLPAWRIELSDGRALKLRGRIDRIDLCHTADGEALVVIADYKSGGKVVNDVKIEHGLELQLLSYLAALTRMPEAGVLFGVDKLAPAGVFYVPLRAKPQSVKTRPEQEQPAANDAAFQHRGRFDGAQLRRFDNRDVKKGDQFKFKLNASGEFAKTGNDAVPAGGFAGLVGSAEAKLRVIGEGIYRGEAAVEPYRLKHETACDLCAYRSVCRFDPWTMPFRRLEAGQQ